METGPGNSNEEPVVNSAKKEMEINASRRSFFGKAAALVTAAALGVKAKDAIEKESKIISLEKKYNKDEIENIKLVNEAANELLELMNKKDINDGEIRISGTGYPDHHVEVLRNFIRGYLVYSGAVKKSAYKEALSVSNKVYFTRVLLTDIMSATSA